MDDSGFQFFILNLNVFNPKQNILPYLREALSYGLSPYNQLVPIDNNCSNSRGNSRHNRHNPANTKAQRFSDPGKCSANRREESRHAAPNACKESRDLCAPSSYNSAKACYFCDNCSEKRADLCYPSGNCNRQRRHCELCACHNKSNFLDCCCNSHQCVYNDSQSGNAADNCYKSIDSRLMLAYPVRNLV